jgi:hypothetical protein
MRVPSSFASGAAISRAVMSTLPPGGNGAIISGAARNQKFV